MLCQTHLMRHTSSMPERASREAWWWSMVALWEVWQNNSRQLRFPAVRRKFTHSRLWPKRAWHWATSFRGCSLACISLMSERWWRLSWNPTLRRRSNLLVVLTVLEDHDALTFVWNGCEARFLTNSCDWSSGEVNPMFQTCLPSVLGLRTFLDIGLFLGSLIQLHRCKSCWCWVNRFTFRLRPSISRLEQVATWLRPTWLRPSGKYVVKSFLTCDVRVKQARSHMLGFLQTWRDLVSWTSWKKSFMEGEVKVCWFTFMFPHLAKQVHRCWGLLTKLNLRVKNSENGKPSWRHPWASWSLGTHVHLNCRSSTTSGGDLRLSRF